MKILIVDDEVHIAKYLEQIIEELRPWDEMQIQKALHFDEAQEILKNSSIDLLFLDLNLRGKDGFELLKYISSAPFHTIIVSAYKERAIEAFEYGILDFVPKPFNKDRIEKAINRTNSDSKTQEHPVKFIGVNQGTKIRLIEENEVLYFEACEHFSKAHLRDGTWLVHDKSLARLTPLLSKSYCRIHKSYLVKISEMKTLKIESGGKYAVEISNGKPLPVGRSRYKEVKDLIV